MRWLLAVVLACSHAEDKPVAEEPSAGELEARKTRAQFTDVITAFHDDVVAGRLDAAFARLAPMTRARATSAIAKQPALAPGVTYTIKGGSISNGLATMSGVLDGPSGRARVELRCTYDGHAWLIS